MRRYARHVRKEGTYKIAAVCGLVCTVVVFGVMMVGGLVMTAAAGIGYRFSA